MKKAWDDCYTVYKHIFPNNKIYIGITRLTPQKRWKNGYGYSYKKSLIHNAIQKYGWENIKHEILYKNLSKEEAEEKEIELIAKYKSNQKEFGYNIANGGSHIGKHSDITKEKISKSKKGSHMSKISREKMAKSRKGEKHWAYGKEFSKEHKEKLSLSHIGHKAWNKGTKRKNWLSEENEKKLYEKQKLAMIGNKYSCKPIICIETGMIYDGVYDAYQKTNINFSNISQVCNKKRKTAGGYHWEHIKKGDEAYQESMG